MGSQEKSSKKYEIIKSFHFVSELDICVISLDIMNYVSIKTQIRLMKRQTGLLFDQRIRQDLTFASSCIIIRFK
jgi:hypothetical protein